MEMTLKEFDIYVRAWSRKEKDLQKLEDIRTARLCSIIANVNRDPKKKPRPYTEKDFMPREKKKMTVEQMEIMLKGITTALGGEVIG